MPSGKSRSDWSLFERSQALVRWISQQACLEAMKRGRFGSNPFVGNLAAGLLMPPNDFLLPLLSCHLCCFKCNISSGHGHVSWLAGFQCYRLGWDIFRDVGAGRVPASRNVADKILRDMNNFVADTSLAKGRNEREEVRARPGQGSSRPAGNVK